jgi:VCBS repeat-containing protein
VPTFLPRLKRLRPAVGGLLLAACMGLAGVALGAGTDGSAGVANAPQPNSLPYVMRPGDVLVNAPVGVIKQTVPVPVLLQFNSAVIGVVRTPPPPQPVSVPLFSVPVGVVRGASISDVLPDQLAVGQNAQALTIQGQGLGVATAVAFDPAADINVSSFHASADGTHIDALVDVGATAARGLRSIRVSTATGSVPEMAPGATQVLIAADLPRIDSVNPNLLSRGSNVVLEIRGANLRGLPYRVQRLGYSEQPEVRITPSDGIVVGSAPQSDDDGQVVNVTIAIDAAAPLTDRLVQVVTASGISTAVLSPANVLHIADGALRTLTPFVSVPVGVTRSVPPPPAQLFAIALPVGVTRGPAVTALNPGYVSPNDNLRLHLGGQQLAGVTSIELSPATGITLDSASLTVTATDVGIDIHVAANAPLIPRRVTAVSGSVRTDAAQLLEIRDAPPVITAMTPTWLQRDGTSQTIALQGQHLGQAAAAGVLPNTDLVIENFTVVDDSNATLTLRSSLSAALGARVVTVTSPAGTSPAAATPNNTLNVVDREQVLTPFVSPIVGIQKGAPVTPDVTRWAYSPAVGVVRGPVALSVQPQIFSRGVTTHVTVSGRALAGTTGASVLPADGLTVRSVVAAPDGLSVSFDVDTVADAVPGMRRVDLVAGSNAIAFAPDDAALVSIDSNNVIGPIAEPDTYSVLTNVPLSVDAAHGLLVNDHDANPGQLYAVLRHLPSAGLVNLNADGSFVYTPNADFVGIDHFDYAAGNGANVGVSTTVTLNVTQANHPVDDHYATNDNQALDVPAAQGLLANDVIANGTTSTIEQVSQPSIGTVSVAANGSFHYVPNGAAGTDHFRYRLVTDGVRSAPADVAILVNDFNEAPVAQDDQYAVDRGHTLNVSAPGVMANDHDPDHDALSASKVSDPLVGSVNFSSSGGFSYTPPVDFVGQVSFIYDIADTHGLHAQAKVTITVNDHLAPLPDAYTLNEGEVLFVDPQHGLLANDSYIPQGSLRIVVTQQPSLGAVQVANDGSFVYRPSTPDLNGSDVFKYRLEDNTVQTASVDVRLTLKAVNDPPQPAPDHYLTDENVALSVPAPGVLTNDHDIDSNVLTARLLAPPQHGAVTVHADGSFSYVPEVNYRGTDHFDYEAVDEANAATPATVSIDVTQPPTATDDVYLVDVSTPLDVRDPKEGLLANDVDAPENDVLSAIMGAPPLHGTATLNPDGTFNYTPDPGYQGIDTFTYKASDGKSESNFGNVTLAVGITSLPHALPDEYTGSEDQELLVNIADGVLANDTDSDTPHDQLRVFVVDYQDGLSLTLNPDGSFRARLPNNGYGDSYFAYKVYDGTSTSNVAIVKLHFLPVNDGVEALDDRYGVLRNTVFQSPNSVGSNDHYDPDYPVRYQVTVPPQFGSVQLDPVNGGFVYTPQQDFSGNDTFTYRIYQVDTDIGDTAVVTLHTNGPPVANPDAYTVNEDSTTVVTPSLLANDSDPDGDVISVYGAYATDNQYITLQMDDAAHPTVTKVFTGGHFYGERTIYYNLYDGTAFARGEIHFTVLPVPDAPIASGDQYLILRNTTLQANTTALSVLYNDFDPDTRPYPNGPVWDAATGVDLLPISAQLVTPTAHGQLTFSPIGTFSYTPDLDYSGVDTFTYRALDATGRMSDVTTVSIRVNSPASAVDDAYVLNEDVPLSVPVAQGLLANDLDLDHDVLHASGAYSGCTPCHGHVDIHEDGSFRYVPDANFYGTDEFYYTVRDNISGTAVGHVSISVLPVNDAPVTQPDTYRTYEDTVLVAPEPQGILKNDREVDGEHLANATVVRPTDHGQVLVQPDGAFTYTPNPNFNGRDTYRYRVYDDSGLWGEDEVEILVTPVNDAPDAADDHYEVQQDQVLVVTAPQGVMANDHDVDGPSLSAALIGSPQHGQVDLLPDGSFTYQPDGIFSGVDTFQYQVDDGLGEVAAASVSIVVRPVAPPVVVTVEDDIYSFEGPSTTIAAPGVLQNDSVQGSDGLAAAVVVAPTVGTLQLDANGGFRYTAPDGYHGIVGFTYSASAQGVSELAHVTLDVRVTTNNPPKAVGEQFGVLEDHVLDSHSSGSLLANDTDYEGSPLSLQVESLPLHGSLQVQSDGNFLYTPLPDYNGPDRIIYHVSDGVKMSNSATASISVFAQNDAPVAQPDMYQATMDTALTVAAAQGVLANDSDVDGDPLHVELVDAPEYGQVQVAADGSFHYQPAPGYHGTDHFRYAAADASARGLAQVTITIAGGGNSPPVVSGEAFAIDEDHLLSSDDVGLLTANDSDPDGDPLQVNLTQPPTHGVLTLDGARFTYQPAANFSGSDAFKYTVSDGQHVSAAVTAAITIRPVNDAPLANTDLYTVVQGQGLSVNAANGLLHNDSDVEQQTLTASVDANPSHGTLVLNADGSFVYTPTASFHGRDEFAYRANDGTDFGVGRVAIDVTVTANQRPIAVGEVFAIPEDSVLDTRTLESLLANDRDPEGQPLTLHIVTPPTAGTLEVLDGGHIRYVPARDATGDVRIGYSVSDGVLDSAPVEVRITLLPVNDAPLAQPDLFSMTASALSLNMDSAHGLLHNDHDVDGDVLIASVVRAPQFGTLSLGLDGSFVYTPVMLHAEHDGFRYRIADPAGLWSEAEAEIVTGTTTGTPDPIFKSGFESTP